MPERKFGWIKSKYDPKDYLHKRGVYPIPDRFSLAQYLTPVRDQGNQGSCVGFGIGINLNSVKVQLGIYGELSDINIWASPRYIYNGARFIEGTLPIDNGCDPRDALEWTLMHGILDEHYWPYVDALLDRSAPSTTRMKQANRYKDFAYFRCVDGTEGICDAISSNHFVSLGSPWFNEWRETNECGRLKKPTSSSFQIGGHETCLFEYDMNEGVFKGVNSWGTSWGHNGLFIMPFESFSLFKDRGGYDAHYITFTKDIDTSPIPEPPAPSPCPWGNNIARVLNKIFLLEERNRKGRFYYGSRS